MDNIKVKYIENPIKVRYTEHSTEVAPPVVQSLYVTPSEEEQVFVPELPVTGFKPVVIGKIELPDTEPLSVTPTTEKQIFESETVGYSPVVVEAVDMQSAYDEGYADGASSLRYAKNITSMFANVTFPEDSVVKIEIPNIENIQSAFSAAKNLKTIILKGNTNNNLVNDFQAFRFCDVTTIDLTEFNANLTSLNRTFQGSTVVEILGELNIANATVDTSCFSQCANLQEVRFAANSIKISINFSSCPLLSLDSLLSILNSLTTLNEGESQTLTLGVTNLLKLTDAQKQIATDKGWTLA